MKSEVLFQAQSTIILLLIYFGVSKRKDRKIHIPVMISAIAWDLLLVLQIELNRGAIAKAAKAMTNPMLLNFHVTIAVSTVLLYFALLYTGGKLSKGVSKFRPWHKKLGGITLILRTMTYITSFFVA